MFAWMLDGVGLGQYRPGQRWPGTALAWEGAGLGHAGLGAGLGGWRPGRVPAWGRAGLGARRPGGALAWGRAGLGGWRHARPAPLPRLLYRVVWKPVFALVTLAAGYQRPRHRHDGASSRSEPARWSIVPACRGARLREGRHSEADGAGASGCASLVTPSEPSATTTMEHRSGQGNSDGASSWLGRRPHRHDVAWVRQYPPRGHVVSAWGVHTAALGETGGTRVSG
jgi:hypothetical protein